VPGHALEVRRFEEALAGGGLAEQLDQLGFPVTLA
jgi:hypothetical protein